MVALADPTSGPAVARSSTTLPCPVVPFGVLQGPHIPSFIRNLVGAKYLQDRGVTATFHGHGGTMVCTDAATGVVLHLGYGAIGHIDLSLAIKTGVQYSLWGGSVLNLGTKRHFDKYFDKIDSLEYPGCFAMTELHHGSNVQGIQTTATFDRSTDEFIINTPNEGATKWWIGNAACHGKFATVFARLRLPSPTSKVLEDLGVHAFIVPLRSLEDNSVLPGVEIRDCGYKVGLNGIDNGAIRFHNVRIPREDMLDRFGTVSADGHYSSEIPSANKRFAATLGELVGGRVGLAFGSVGILKAASTIAVRYSLLRQQFGPPNKPEIAILDYQSQQQRLMPMLASAYAFHFATNELVQQYAEMKRTKDEALVSEVHVLSAGLKAYVTSYTQAAISTCREACGGHGYAAVNRFGRMRNDHDIFQTFEGDNTVLLQQVAADLLKHYKEKFSGGALSVGWNYLRDSMGTYLAQTNPVTTHREGQSHLRDPQFQLDAFQYRTAKLLHTAALRLRKHSRRMGSFEAWNRCLNHLLVLAESHVESVILARFIKAVERCEDKACKSALKTMCDLYALERIWGDIGTYRNEDYVAPNKAKAIHRLVEFLCYEARGMAKELVDSFGIPDDLLKAPIGLQSGHPPPCSLLPPPSSLLPAPSSLLLAPVQPAGVGAVGEAGLLEGHVFPHLQLRPPQSSPARQVPPQDDAWRAEFGDEAERPRWAELLRSGVAIFDLDYDAILAAMYALSVSAEGECYLCVPPDPGIEAAALGASESALPGTAPAEALHTFLLDSGASRCFFHDSTTLTPLSAPVPVRLAEPSGGPVLASSSTVLPCPAVPSGSLSGLHLPSFSTNLVSTAALQDAMVTTTTPVGQRVSLCTCTRTGRHLATFTRRPGSGSTPLLVSPPVAPDPPGGAEPRGAEPGGTEPEGVELGGAGFEGAVSGGARGSATGGTRVGGTEATRLGGAGVTAGIGAAGAGGVGGAGAGDPGAGGARAGGIGAGGAGAGGAGYGGAGAGDPGAGGTGAGGTGASGAGAEEAGAGDTGAGGAGAGGNGAGGTGVGSAGAGGARAGDLGAGGAGAGGVASCGTSARGTVQRRPFFVPPPPWSLPPPDSVLRQPQLQPYSPLPAPSPYVERTDSLTERREPESHPALPVRAVRTGYHVLRPRPPPIPGTNIMALRPSSVPLRAPLPSPPASSLDDGPDPESDLV
ncbi:unnamed protein product [Closterium sp. NIES-54]